MKEESVCSNCFLWHERKGYCSLDGKLHKGCFQNFMPKSRLEVDRGNTDTD